MDRVRIIEVSPRDGFQSIGPFIPTAPKIEIVEALTAPAVTRMEVGSFVSPTALSQMADPRAMLDVTNPQCVRPDAAARERSTIGLPFNLLGESA
jgi:isopropylmalate/homocitrate/citramalate synthase